MSGLVIQDLWPSCVSLQKPLSQDITGSLPVVELFCCETLDGCAKATYCSPKTVSLFQEPIKCKAPGNPENGHSSGEIYTVGAEVTFSCEKGHQLMGTTKLTCLESGEWSHPIPYCEGVFNKFPMFMVFGDPRHSRGRNVKDYIASVFLAFKTQLLGSFVNVTRKPRAVLELAEILPTLTKNSTAVCFLSSKLFPVVHQLFQKTVALMDQHLPMAVK